MGEVSKRLRHRERGLHGVHPVAVATPRRTLGTDDAAGGPLPLPESELPDLRDEVADLVEAVAGLTERFNRVEVRVTRAAFIGAAVVAGVFEAVVRFV